MRMRWIWGVVLAAVALGAYFLFPHAMQGRSTAAPPAARGAAAPGGSSRAIPVVAAPARKGDLPIYLTGLGTATAFNTVTVRSRVDGQLMTVAFQEGQFVRQGDLLVQVDPRPFEVQLTQAEGQYAKDEAALKNARLDLQRYQGLFEHGLIPRQQLDSQAIHAAQPVSRPHGSGPPVLADA